MNRSTQGPFAGAFNTSFLIGAEGLSVVMEIIHASSNEKQISSDEADLEMCLKAPKKSQ